MTSKSLKLIRNLPDLRMVLSKVFLTVEAITETRLKMGGIFH